MTDNTVTMFAPAYTTKKGYLEVSGDVVDNGTRLLPICGGWDKEIGKEIFPTIAEARAAAERDRLARLASLRRSIAKLEALSHA